jgi:sporulation protein YhbH
MEAERISRRKGYRQVGIRVRLDKRRTVKAKIKREVATHRGTEEERTRFPFHYDDLTYRHLTTEIRKESNAVVIAIMDTSGSMDTMKKYLARSFFFLLSQFVSTKYQTVEIVFVAHHTEAAEVTEEDFFHKGESGGTFVSSGYRKALDIIEARYHPSHWNIYVFHCSDGDNFDSDNSTALQCAAQLCRVSNLFGYGEIKPHGITYYENSMLKLFNQLEETNFHTVLIERKEDVWPSFKSFLAKDRAAE